jgi:type IV pilus assembly protein PilV
MKTLVNPSRAQGGSFLLEALIGVLIFSFGILGIVGLQAASLRHTGESEYRAEAMYYANSLISQMWTDDPAGLKGKYDSTVGGAGYTAFSNTVTAVGGLPGAGATPPIVLVDPAKDCANTNDVAPPPSLQSHVVVVCVYWQVPGDADIHNYMTVGVVGANPS